MPSDILSKTKDYWFFENWAHANLPNWVKEVTEEVNELKEKVQALEEKVQGEQNT